MTKTKKRALVCLICAALLTPAATGVVRAERGETVSVACIDYNSFLTQADDGSYTGYAADYLARIAEYTGWRYEFVDMDWPTAFEAVREGRVDFYCVARQTEARQNDFDFSLYPVCNEEMNLYTLPDSEIYYEDFAAFDGMRVGMLSSSGEIDYFIDYAAENDFDYTITEYPLNDAAVEALRAGEVDAIALVDYSIAGDFKLLGNFGVSPAYMMSRDGSEHMARFSRAQERLYFDDPNFTSELEETYYGEALRAFDLLLTRGEADYIENADTLNVALSRDMAPLEYYDEQEGEFRGVTVDLLRRISELTGLDFAFVPREDTPALRESMQSGEVRLVGAMARNDDVAEALGLIQSEPFSESAFSLVTEDMTALAPDSAAAVPSGYPMFADTARRAGYDNIVEYGSMNECVRAVFKGDAQLTYIITACEGYLLDHVQYADLRSVVLQDTNYGICVGVANSPDSSLLLSILNKSVSVIPKQEINDMLVRNTAQAKPPLTLTDFVVKNRVTLSIFGALLCAAAVFYASYAEKARKRRALDEKRRQYNEFLQRLYDTLPCGIFRYEYEPPHRILSYNASCARIYGYEDGQFPVVGEPPDAVVEAGTEAAFQREFERCEKAGGPISYVWPITRKDGSQSFTESVMDIVETEQGKVFQEIVIDVTERMLRETEIAERYSQELQRRDMRDKGMLYMACFDVTEQVLAETDIDSQGIYAGMSIADSVVALTRELKDLQTDEAMDDLATRFTLERLERDYENGEYEQSFLLCRLKDDKPQWIRSDLALRRNPSNDHLMCFDYIWDVTDEYITNEIIRRMALADCEGFMSVYLPTRRCLQYAAGQGGELARIDTKYGLSDMICDMTARMSAENALELRRATELSAVESCLETQGRYRVYATLEDKNGERLDKALTFFYTDKDKGLLAVTVSDVTEVRRDEVRHAELLSDALAAAERADAAKSLFLSSVSHEMRTPLNAIIGFMELAKGADEKTMKEYLASSDIAAKQLLSVINDVLDMSSIESGKLKIAHAPFNFRHLISSVTNVYGSQCKRKGVEFETRITAPVDDWLVGDELRVNQILMNLLGNAVKFTSEGKITLAITKTEVGGDKVFMRFVVSDTGSGMSEDMLNRLFMPFEQESAETASRYGGSGLGLSIVKSLVQLMDGVIRVESKLGEGTVFTVDLPFARSGLIADTRLRGKFESLRVLVVDDEPDARVYMSTALERLGVRYACANGGGEALVAMEQAERENDLFNVCLIDWRMPAPDGFDTTSLIRKRYGEDVVVIVVSAYDFQQAGAGARASGANLLLSKPVFQSALFDLFMTLTGGKLAKTADGARAWDFSGRRILLAEDNELNQVVALGCLERCGFEVDLAEDGQSAVDKFLASEEGYYDAILMDIQMPALDGLAATRAIRESNHPQAKTIKIIAQTANAFNEDIAKALSAGMDAHVAKPIDSETLYRTLAAHLGCDETGDLKTLSNSEPPASTAEAAAQPDERSTTNGADKQALAAAGVDYDKGVRRFRGKPHMYEKYLLKFFESDPMPALKEQLEAGDVEAAFRATHDLKGTAGNLCMERLFETIHELTELLRAGDNGEKATMLCERAARQFDEAKKAALG